MAKSGESGGTHGQLLIYRPDQDHRVTVRIDGETVWLTQRLISELYDVTVSTINEHIKLIYADRELSPEATIRKFRIVQTEGSRSVERTIDHYNLDLIIAVGYRVRSARGTHFRQWATAQIRELLIKGFVLDDERIKAGRSIGQDYFDELLARIRDIRASERMFYRKVIEIYTTSVDYDKDAEITLTFFKTVQNKLHYAVHGQTAAEIVKTRADAKKPSMGLTTWKNAPKGAIRKADVDIAKNYLTQQEIEELNRIVTMYLDYAEDQARNKKPMYMRDWIEKLDGFLRFNEREILKDRGRVSHALARQHAHQEYQRFDAERLLHDASRPTDFDNLIERSNQMERSLPPPSKKHTRRSK